MTFRLRTIDVMADGRTIVRDRDIAAERLTIGRAATNDIHLPDLAIDPEHAAMELRGGRLAVEARQGSRAVGPAQEGQHPRARHFPAGLRGRRPGS
jgi:hypothetical protein